MTVKIWPQDYEKKDHINKEERFLLRSAKSTMYDGHFVVGIDPIGFANEKVHMGFLIVPSEGLLTFSIYRENLQPELAESYINYVMMVENAIHERLLDAKALIVKKGENKFLKFPYKHVIVFVNEKKNTISCSRESREKLESFVTMGFFNYINNKGKDKRDSISTNFYNTRFPCVKENIEIRDIEAKAIFERLAPEYTVVIPEREIITVKENSSFQYGDYLISGNEVEYKTFFLDEYQVAQVNDIGKGHRVILANPGAGKSVILLAKAFKYASLYKDSKVLLTCYNNNLADSYLFRRNCANFGNNKNLYIMNFHKLVQKLFTECLGLSLFGEFAEEEHIKLCIEKVKSGEIDIRFKAIFIDEVQIFEPLFLDLCYCLLEKDDSTFLMAGDLNQTVRAQSRHGDVPWKKFGDASLDFTGRVKYIEKNYRNSKVIGEYLNHMLCYMNKKMNENGLEILSEYNYELFKLTEKKGIALEIKTGIKRIDVQKHVIESIIEISEKYEVGYSDIAVIFPNKDHKSLSYHFMYWMIQGLNDEGIPYSLITTFERKTKSKYSQTSGIVLSTIDASLGLDFKAVIVAGLYPYNYVFSEYGKKRKFSSWEDLELMNETERENAQIQMRKIYTACSRAREVLYVISDIEEGSPLEDIIKQ